MFLPSRTISLEKLDWLRTALFVSFKLVKISVARLERWQAAHWMSRSSRSRSSLPWLCSLVTPRHVSRSWDGNILHPRVNNANHRNLLHKWMRRKKWWRIKRENSLSPIYWNQYGYAPSCQHWSSISSTKNYNLGIFWTITQSQEQLLLNKIREYLLL